jgi:3-dehydroquinate dehydratase-2
MRNRIQVIHGVNFDVLDRRDPSIYGGKSLSQLEMQVKRYAQEVGFETTFEQTNHEGEFCELLHRSREMADGLVLNPGAWTHYSYAIRDALEVASLPAVEVHLSAIEEREEFRSGSVIRDLCIGTVSGKGIEGYREAVQLLHDRIKDAHDAR